MNGTKAVLAFPKPVRKEDPDYLRYVRRQGCLVHPQVSAIAHHVEAGGMATKCSDYRTVALCYRCHQELHNIGRKAFETKHRVDFNLEMILFLEKFVSALREGENLGQKA